MFVPLEGNLERRWTGCVPSGCFAWSSCGWHHGDSFARLGEGHGRSSSDSFWMGRCMGRGQLRLHGTQDHQAPWWWLHATCWTSSTMSRRSQQPKLRRKWCLWRETLLWCLSLGPVLDLYSGWLVRRDLTSQLTCPSYRRAWMTWPATTSTRSTRSSAMSRWRQMQAFASSPWIHQIWFW